MQTFSAKFYLCSVCARFPDPDHDTGKEVIPIYSFSTAEWGPCCYMALRKLSYWNWANCRIRVYLSPLNSVLCPKHTIHIRQNGSFLLPSHNELSKQAKPDQDKEMVTQKKHANIETCCASNCPRTWLYTACLSGHKRQRGNISRRSDRRLYRN